MTTIEVSGSITEQLYTEGDSNRLGRNALEQINIDEILLLHRTAGTEADRCFLQFRARIMSVRGTEIDFLMEVNGDWRNGSGRVDDNGRLHIGRSHSGYFITTTPYSG